jgi:Rrf2 family nitric oxide-sensitive transcriptional repressor
MISNTTEYALRAVIFLGQDNQSAYTAQQISMATQVPLPYLSKILNGLVRTNLVTSQRGLGGGFALAVNPNKLTLLQVLDAVEPVRGTEHCPPSLDKKRGNSCPLHALLNESVQRMRSVYADSTVGELIAQDKGAKTKLCIFQNSSKIGAKRA